MKPYFERPALAILLLLLSGVVCQQVVFSDDVDDHDDHDDCPTVSIQETGPSHADLSATVAQALNSCQVREILSNSRYRLLFSEFLSPSTELYHDIKDETDMFQATVYDYTRGRVILINGIIFDPLTYHFAEANIQPNPSGEELTEAARIAGIRPSASEFASGYMPPFISRDFPDGTSHRLLHLAISSRDSNRLVYVNMNNGTVESTEVKPAMCEAPADSHQASITAKTALGTANLVISQNGKELWTFEAIRPSVSSGTNGAGIELRDVKYRGKSVLYQASVPILNVEYEKKDIPGCGPYYRDWQNEEYPLRCKQGKDFAPWLRLCQTPATTIVDPPHIDGGDFTGVAVSIEGQEVVLKSQLTASWYRYTSEWRFHVDGTLRPRWGFGGVLKGANCVCQIHHHHVYWRLDFDIVSAGNNLVREFNKPPIFPGTNYHDKIYEIKRPKDPAHNRHWEVSSTRTGETYALFPGSNDGVADDFGVGDLWVLKYHPNELDDGVGFTNQINARTDIDKFKNGEVVKDTDVVIWYGAHFKHDQMHGGEGGHILGPDIRPVKW